VKIVKNYFRGVKNCFRGLFIFFLDNAYMLFDNLRWIFRRIIDFSLCLLIALVAESPDTD
jgi:hypothetical protein